MKPHRPGEELKGLLADAFSKRTSAEWLRDLEAADILCSPINTLEQALEDPQVRHNGMVIEFEHPQGPARDRLTDQTRGHPGERASRTAVAWPAR